MLRNFPILTKHFRYETKFKRRGLDHVWGEITVGGKSIVTIDFWKDDINFWRPGENAFGYKADEDLKGK